MRIGLNGSDLSEITAKQNAASHSPATAQSESVQGDASVSLQSSVTVGSLVAQTLQTPEVRQDKVESIRQAIASGEYKLNAKASAEGILSE